MFDEAQISSADSTRELEVLDASTSRGNRQMLGLGMAVGSVARHVVHVAVFDLQKDIEGAESARSDSMGGVDSRCLACRSRQSS